MPHKQPGGPRYAGCIKPCWLHQAQMAWRPKLHASPSTPKQLLTCASQPACWAGQQHTQQLSQPRFDPAAH